MKTGLAFKRTNSGEALSTVGFRVQGLGFRVQGLGFTRPVLFLALL